MDLIVYALLKKKLDSVVSGISEYEVDGQTLRITTSDGQVLEMTFPEPAAGISITNVEIDKNNHLFCTMSDGNQIDSGEIKTIQGPKGDSGVYLGSQEPEDNNIKVWIDPEGQAGVAAKDVLFNDNEDLQTKYDNNEFAGGGQDGYTKKQVDDKLNLKVDRVTESDKGRSEFQNMEDGNQILFLTNDGKRANISVNDGSHGVYVQLGAMDKETNEGVRLELGLDNAYLLVGDTPDYTEQDEIITRAAMEHETSDLLQGLSRHLIAEDEDPEFSGQTIVEVKTRNGATETIMEIDNMDVTTDVPVNAVLGAIKGHDLDKRLSDIEDLLTVANIIPTIEIMTSMSDEDRKSHIYPELALSPEQIKIIVEHNATLLKIKFVISGTSADTEADTLVFYTTIDDNYIERSGNTVQTIKINAVRTNNEGTIVYHGELLGNGKIFDQSINLTPKYIPFN